MRTALAITALFLIAPARAAAQRNGPEDAKLVTADIARFWRAYDRLATAGSRADSLRALFEAYYVPASPGLESFIGARIGSVYNLLYQIRSHPRYYASIRESTLRVASFEDEIRADLRAFQKLYPEADMPDIYFVIGRMSSGGTTSSDRILIGTEMYGRTPDLPVEELNDWHRTVLRPIEDVPTIVAHELIHTQQTPNQQDRSLLAAVLVEGSADFVAELVTGGNINEHLKAWAEPREAELWAEFHARMDREDYSGWLYGGSSETDRPADLGYWMGYRITRAYYERAEDKRAAIREILTMDDPHAFLEKSGYAQRFAAN